MINRLMVRIKAERVGNENKQWIERSSASMYRSCVYMEWKRTVPNQPDEKKSLRRPVSQGEEIAKSEGSGRVGKMIAQKNRDGESESEWVGDM